MSNKFMAVHVAAIFKLDRYLLVAQDLGGNKKILKLERSHSLERMASHARQLADTLNGQIARGLQPTSFEVWPDCLEGEDLIFRGASFGFDVRKTEMILDRSTSCADQYPRQAD